MAILRRSLFSRLTPKTLLLVSSLLLLCFTLVSYRDLVAARFYTTKKWYGVVGVPEDAAGLLFRELAANATLGFQSILALSQGTRWRVQGLEAAAALTGLSIEIPPYRPVEPDELAAFKKLGPHVLGNGSATAWLAHLNLLRYVVEQNYDTALILEDDADWDVSLKEQMKLVSDGVRNLFNTEKPKLLYPYPEALAAPLPLSLPISSVLSPPPLPPSSLTSSHPPAPYTRTWDVLWIGHCGENVAEDTATWRRPATSNLRLWHDPSVVPSKHYSGFAHNSMKLLPPGMRSALISRGPVCTFAYAVTRAAAPKLLELAGTGDDQAFDVKLGKLCREGRLSCVSVAPEVVHEYRPLVEGDGVTSSEVNAGNGQGMGVGGDAALELGMGTTVNVVRSARCAALYQGSRCFPGRVDG